MLASKGFRLALQATGVLAIVFALLHWQFGGVQNVRSQNGREVAVQGVKEEQDLSARNTTLGFEAILALSRGTKWRVDGLRAAANASGIDLQIPAQPKWSDAFIKAFQEFGPVEAHGAAMAWLAHIDLLKFVVQNNFGSALILEDDQDWSVDIRNQTERIAKSILDLTGRQRIAHTPYGTDWDVLWMGHCSDPPDVSKPFVVFDDDTTAPLDRYKGLNRHIVDVIKEGQRAVHFSVNPVCTWAYAVSHAGARKLLEFASNGKGGAFDLMMMYACQRSELRCISVNPQIFDPYHPAEGDESEVRAGDNGGEDDFATGRSNKVMGRTDNILKSARCQALFNDTCLLEMDERGP